MAIIAMAVWDTEENGKSKYTLETLKCLYGTVYMDRHRIVVIDNNSCRETKDILEDAQGWGVEVITLPENVGTARAINHAIRLRKPGEHVIKMDNDVLIHSDTWVDEMEQAIEREPMIGICGLKRKDLWQRPDHENKFYRSELHLLNQKPGEDWIVIEKTADIMGTCTMFNYRLLDKIGYMWQPSLYGFDDGLICYRSNLAGFINCFLPHIRIDHIDPGGGIYEGWKRNESGKVMDEFNKIKDDLIAGRRPLYEDFY